MHRNKQIAIILPDTLQSIGLQSMLTDYFPPVEISHYPTFEALSTSGNDTFDYYLQMPLHLSFMQTFSSLDGARQWS